MKALLVLFLIVGCSDPDFEKFSELEGLRIVAIVADTPEIDADAAAPVNVTLTPYISDVSAAGRVFNVTVTGCVDPGVAQGGDVLCNSDSFVYPNANTFDTATLAANNYTGAMDPVTIAIPAPNTLTTGLSTQDRFNGVSYLVYFVFESGGERLIAFKAINMSTRATLNQNPAIQDIRLDGNVLAASPKVKGDLSYTSTVAGAPENYLEMNQDGSTFSNQESYLMSWFVTTDSFVSPARTVEGQVSRFGPKQDTINPTLIGVLRDRRGGTAVQILQP
jgi:hypothetical protein